MVANCLRASRTVLVTTLSLLLIVCTAGMLVAQAPLPPPAGSFVNLPPEFEATIIDLVERYEELRELLRRERLRTENLYSATEIEAATAALRDELAAAQRDVLYWQRAYKAATHTAKQGYAEARHYKDRLVKELGRSELRYADLRYLYETVQPERLLSAGATFYPEGYLGAMLQVRMPGSPLGFYAEGLYRSREQDYFYGFGVSYSFLSHRTLVEGWQWLRSLFNRQPQGASARTARPTGAPADSGAGGKASTFGSGVQLPDSPRP